MEDVILYNESVNEVYVEGAISFVEKLKRLWKAFLDLLKRIKIKLKMVFNKDMRQFNKFKYIINSPEGHEKEIDILKNTMCDKWDTDYTKKLFAKCNELCTLILDFKFKIGPIMGGDKTYDISGAESMFGKLETVDDEIKQMAKTKPSVIKYGWSKYDAIKALIEEHELMKEYFVHFDDVERFCGDIDYAINHYHDNMTSDTIECLTKLVKLWTNSFTHMRDIFNITSHVSSAMAFEDSKRLSSILNQHTDDSGRRAKNGNSESVQEKIEKAKAARREYAQQARAIEADILKDMEDARSQLKSTTKENKPSYYDELKKKQGLDYHKEYYTKGVNNMEDVILYNESWDIDKLSPYNTFYMEGSIIDGLKRIWKAFLNLLKRIKQRLQYTFGKDARVYRMVAQGLKNPKVVDDWKEKRCDKWDFSVAKELLTKSDELCECILNVKIVFDDVESVAGRPTWSPSTLSRLSNNITAVDKINNELKSISEKEVKPPVENGQTVYELAQSWVEMYEIGVRYYMHHDEVIKFIREMDKVIKSLPENQAEFTTKMVQQWCTGLMYLDKKELTAPKGAMLNARVDSRDTLVQVKTMLDDNTKILENTLKNVREANKNADKSIADTEKFMRNNKALFKKYDPFGESYMEGMNGMDVILYNDNTEPQVTTESAVEEKEPLTLEEVDAYIESVMDELNDAMDLRSRMIQESDDAAADTDTSSGDADTSSDDGVDSPDTVEEGCSVKKDTKKTQPVKESYVLDGSAIFGESYNHMDDVPNMMPNRFYQEFNPDTTGAVLGAIVGHQVHNTIVIAGITANVMAIVTAVDSIVASATYKKKYGRFADDMKAVMDILKDSKDGTIKTDLLHKALSTLKDDCDTISGKGIISHKAQVNLTATERSEIKQLSTIIKDLKRMLTSKPDKAAERRISARIEDFVAKCETVTKLLNRGKNPGDVVREYMS